jgi:proteasome lid subunit RPN8/RPN11
MEQSARQPLLLASEIYQAMIEQCLASPSRSCCGYLAGTSSRRATAIYPLRNVARDANRDEASPEDQLGAVVDLRSRGLETVAIYHSFPEGHPPLPSRADLREHYYGDTPRVIVAPGKEPTVRAWRLFADSYEELDWQVLPQEKRPAPGNIQVHSLPSDILGKNPAPEVPSSLWATLSHVLLWWKPSPKPPVPPLQDPSAPWAEPMWDPFLDNPR